MECSSPYEPYTVLYCRSVTMLVYLSEVFVALWTIHNVLLEICNDVSRLMSIHNVLLQICNDVGVCE